MKTTVKSIAVFAMLLCFSFAAKAVSMGQIVGQITGPEANQPLAFAQIVFENKMDKIEVAANEYGHYYSNHMPTGKYTMTVMYNNRAFIMNVQVYDEYTSEINMAVSADSSLPQKVLLPTNQNLFSSVSKNDPRLSNSDNRQPSQTLNDVISRQPGCDVRDGKIVIKGSSQVRIFIDGEPVMGAPTQNRVW